MAAEREEVARFTAFLQIRSISGEGPHGSYQAAVDWLQAFVAQHLQLHSEVVSPKDWH
jgi:hypothetical protein